MIWFDIFDDCFYLLIYCVSVIVIEIWKLNDNNKFFLIIKQYNNERTNTNTKNIVKNKT